MSYKIVEILTDAGFSGQSITRLLEQYKDPIRQYHGLAHIEEMLEFAERHRQSLDNTDYHILQLAIIYHDVVLDPRAKDNESRSYERFCEDAGPQDPDKFGRDFFEKVRQLIMATVDHEIDENTPPYIRCMVLADLDRFNGEFADVWRHTVELFHEYAFVDWADFKTGRLKFLAGYKDKIRRIVGEEAGDNVERIITALSVWEPRIAVYPGSFDPFHVGHEDILSKAEDMFDKVIIAVGNNPEKGVKSHSLPAIISNNHQVELYEGMLTDYIKGKTYPLTVIRGLRNSTDLQSELNQLRFMEDMSDDIKVCFIACDREFEHVSSSAIRTIKKINPDKTSYEL